MFLFGKSKSNDKPEIANVSSNPVQSTQTAQSVSADDFFADLDKKAKPKTSAAAAEPVNPDIETPEVIGLREEPIAFKPSTMNDVETDTQAAENLTDKTIGDDGNYHGNMNDAYEKPEEEKPRDLSSASSAEDFFSNMGRKAAPKPAEPVVLREEPLPETHSSMNGLDVSTLGTDDLRDKSFEVNDENYHGNMNDIPDQEAIDTDTLAVKRLKPDADDSANVYTDDEPDIDESSIVVDEINE